MTNPNHTNTSRSGDLVKECRLDAKAFRENTVYDSDGDPIRLIANAERLDQYADRIEALEAENERLRGELQEIIAYSQKHIDDTDAYTMSRHKIQASRAALAGDSHVAD